MTIEFQNRPLRDWLPELVSTSREVRRAAGDAMMAMYFDVASTTAEFELEDAKEKAEQHTAHWRQAVRDAIEEPAFPRRAYFISAAARLVGAHDDYLRELATDDPQFTRICDRIGEQLSASATEQERAAHMRRLGRAFCASIDRMCNSEPPDFEAMSLGAVTLQWVIEAAGPTLLEAPEALWMLLESQGMRYVAEKALISIGPPAAPMFLEHFLDEFRKTQFEERFGNWEVLAALARGNVETIELLLLAMEEWPIEAAWAAAATLHRMGDTARQCEQTTPALLRLASSPEGQRRAAAAYALGGVTRGLDVAVDRLLELTHDTHKDERGYGGQIVAGAAMTALGEIGRQPGRVVPRILEMFESFAEFDSDMGYGGNHARQVDALEQLQGPAAQVLPVIIAALERRLDEGMDQWNDDDLLSLLRSYGSEAAEAIPILEKLAAADDERRRQEAEAWEIDDDEDEDDEGADSEDSDWEDEESSIRKAIRAIRGSDSN